MAGTCIRLMSRTTICRTLIATTLNWIQSGQNIATVTEVADAASHGGHGRQLICNS